MFLTLILNASIVVFVPGHLQVAFPGRRRHCGGSGERYLKSPMVNTSRWNTPRAAMIVFPSRLRAPLTMISSASFVSWRGALPVGAGPDHRLKRSLVEAMSAEPSFFQAEETTRGGRDQGAQQAAAVGCMGRR